MEDRAVVLVRMPASLREKLEQRAVVNERSMSAEAMLIIRAGLESKQPESPR